MNIIMNFIMNIILNIIMNIIMNVIIAIKSVRDYPIKTEFKEEKRTDYSAICEWKVYYEELCNLQKERIGRYNKHTD